MQFIPSLEIGLSLGLVNWLLWRLSLKKLLSNPKKGEAFLGFLSLAKFGILGGLIWILMAKYKMDAVGFLLGFSTMMIPLLIRGLKWN